MTRRIGLLGGTFDPVHRGHVGLGTAAQTALQLTELHLIPTHVSPHRRQPSTSVFHRFAMVALAAADHPNWLASDVELRADGPSYTATTLRRFREAGARASELFFVIGADAFADIQSWREFPAVLDQAHFAVVSRPGFPVTTLPERLPALARRMTTDRPPSAAAETTPQIILLDCETPDVSSTEIRRRRAEQRPVDDLVVPAVARYIERHGLYSAQASESAAPHTLDPGR